MTRKFLARVAACAGLGAAALLICAPGAALADQMPPDHAFEPGRIYTVPKGVRPGHNVKIILECDRPVEFPYAWSKITGRVWLKYRPPAQPSTPPPVPPDQPPGSPSQPPQQPGQPPLPPGQPPLPSGQPSQQPGQPPLPPGQPSDDGPSLPPDQPPLPDGGQPQPPSADQPADTPAEGAGGQASTEDSYRYEVQIQLSDKVKPGHYELRGSCGSRGKLIVLPKGSVAGGDGGAAGTGGNTGAALAGAGMLGVAAAVGGAMVLTRRRRAGEQAG